MSAAGRRVVVLGALVGLALMLGVAVIDLPPFGTFSGGLTDYLLRHAVPERHATNVVMAVTFDYRGLDTLGEELILFAAVSAVALLLRDSRQEVEYERPVDAQPVEALRVLGIGFSPILVVVGLWLVAHGHLTAGGGFQGGVVLAAGAVFGYLTGSYRGFRRVTPEAALDGAESVGVLGFVGIGLAGLVGTGAFLYNLLPYGRPGDLDSSGTILVLDVLVGLVVAAGFVLLVTEFLEAATAARSGSGDE